MKENNKLKNRVLCRLDYELMILVLLIIVLLPSKYLPQWTTVIGITFDMIGAILVTIELVYLYHGQKYTLDDLVHAQRSGGSHSPDDIETKGYKFWQIKKFKFMFWGLVLLMSGFYFKLFLLGLFK